jgi:hypothetical protein
LGLLLISNFVEFEGGIINDFVDFEGIIRIPTTTIFVFSVHFDFLMVLDPWILISRSLWLRGGEMVYEHQNKKISTRFVMHQH